MTTNCFFAENMLSAFVDGELDREKRLSITEHVAACGKCRIKKEIMLSTVNMTRNVRVPMSVAVIESWEAEFRAKISRTREPLHRFEHRFWRGWKKLATIALGALVGMLLGVRVYIEFEKRSYENRNVFEALTKEKEPPKEVPKETQPVPQLRLQVDDVERFEKELREFFKTLPYRFLKEDRSEDGVANASYVIELEKEAFPVLINYLESLGKTVQGASDDIMTKPETTFLLVIEGRSTPSPN